jgi:hypothetical protein
MKSIAICFLTFVLFADTAAAMSEEKNPGDGGSSKNETVENNEKSEEFDVFDDGFHWSIESTDRHRHHSHVALFRRRTDADVTCTHVLDIPFFSLYTRHESDDRSDLRILSLPIIGSIYRHRVDGKRHSREFLYLIEIDD